MNAKLWYEQPAGKWEEALPVGNGRLGGMVFGGARTERIQLNEDTLWSGFPRDRNHYDAPRHLKKVRELLLDRRYLEAEGLVRDRMLGPWTESYQPLADLYLEQQLGEVSYVRRELDLKSAVARTVYTGDGIGYTRDVYVSAPDQTLVVQVEADKPGAINLTAALTSPHPVTVSVADGNTLVLQGRAPTHVEPDYVRDHPAPVLYEPGLGTAFEVRLAVKAPGGVVSIRRREIALCEPDPAGELDGNRRRISRPYTEGQLELVVEGADQLTLMLAASTSFNGYNGDQSARAADLPHRCARMLETAFNRESDELLARHISEHQRLFNRLALTLGGSSEYESLPTDKRLEAVAGGAHDPGFAALYMQFGRYLLISCSRPGTQPVNLQGIWNERIQPPWSSNYTTNINVQMNYWLAEPGNLSECHEPLLKMVEELQETGSRTARIHYQCGGWTTHHNVDIWRCANPASGEPVWSFWPMGGIWLASHMWEHYAFTGDESFLRDRAYPAMKGAAEFALDWLIEDERGRLVTSPSTSPENYFLTAGGEPCSVDVASTMDMALIRTLFRQCELAAQTLGIDADFRAKLNEAADRLLPFQIGQYGQLQEWSEDFDEHEPGHRHWSHLYGLYPGDIITPHAAPDLAAASRASVKRRLDNGGGQTGWSGAWAINLFARLHDGDEAYRALQSVWKNSSYPSLLNVHPPFQIDGNFGAAAGILEMLLQSHESAIRLLPAFPPAWSEGAISGIRARGGFVLDISWSEGRLAKAIVRSMNGGTCRIAAAAELECDAPGAVSVHGELQFDTAAGGTYTLRPTSAPSRPADACCFPG